jgi:hypothetical protein
VAEGENHTSSHDEVGLVCGISVVSQRKDRGGGSKAALPTL